MDHVVGGERDAFEALVASQGKQTWVCFRPGVPELSDKAVEVALVLALVSLLSELPLDCVARVEGLGEAQEPQLPVM